MPERQEAVAEPPRGGPIRTVVFADQPTVPAKRHERVYVWDRLLEYAVRHPDRRVLLRPPHRASERTFHRMELSPERWAETRELPPNLRIDHTPIVELLPVTDLLLTETRERLAALSKPRAPESAPPIPLAAE